MNSERGGGKDEDMTYVDLGKLCP